MRSIKKI